MEECIQVALGLVTSEPKRGYKVFDERIRRKQLPWTENMFRDMHEFSLHLFTKISTLIQ